MVPLEECSSEGRILLSGEEEKYGQSIDSHARKCHVRLRGRGGGGLFFFYSFVVVHPQVKVDEQCLRALRTAQERGQPFDSHGPKIQMRCVVSRTTRKNRGTKILKIYTD